MKTKRQRMQVREQLEKEYQARHQSRATPAKESTPRARRARPRREVEISAEV